MAVWVDMSSTEVVEAYDAWLKAEALEDRIPAVPQRDHDGPCFFKKKWVWHFQTAD